MMNPKTSDGTSPRQTDLDEQIAGDPAAAAIRLRAHLVDHPFDADAYRSLARALNDSRGSTPPPRVGVRSSIRFTDSILDRAMQAMAENDFPTAGVTVQRRLFDRPNDPEALMLMANVAIGLNYVREGEQLLRLALAIASGLTTARIDLARLLDRRDRPTEALVEIERVLEEEPGNLPAKAVQAEALSRAGRYADSIRVYEELLQTVPEEPGLWTAYGHVLKTLGRTGEAVRALRQATRLSPSDGDAWWNLANLKTFRFEPNDVTAMQEALKRDDVTDKDRWNIHFALGKAFEDSKSLANSFRHYEQANSIIGRQVPYAADAIASEVERSIDLYSSEFFHHRKGWGASEPDPVFIIGMPRAGSTLVEQILASHPSVEGTRELLNIPNIAIELADGGTQSYLPAIKALNHDAVLKLGQRYLEETRSFRVLGKPRFTDKLPDNWFYAGLIILLLPNAKIIDARRHPLACGLSNFKQNFGTHLGFSYDLSNIGHRYRLYVRMMAHFDEVLPGRIHRVIHERLVTDPESEIRDLLDYLELPFDQACLRFHESDRAVRSPSSEQVRRPLQTDQLESWRDFEPWLGPLKEALGPLVDCYPEVPAIS
jgi:tetratricopeptide (TPR) repeat protein